MAKLKELINKTWRYMRVDGLLHIETSALIYLILFKLFNILFGILNVELQSELAMVASFFVTIIVGFIKEIYDYKIKGIAERHDVQCDLIGITLGVLISIL